MKFSTTIIGETKKRVSGFNPPLIFGVYIVLRYNVESHMKALVSRFITNESGVTAIEYGLIAALIAVIIIGAVSTVGTSLSGTFSTVASSL
jgi:pilus assembly protein Flp/PilA